MQTRSYRIVGDADSRVVWNEYIDCSELQIDDANQGYRWSVFWKVLYLCFNNSSCEFTKKQICDSAEYIERGWKYHHSSLFQKWSSFSMFSSIKKHMVLKFVKSWNLLFTLSFTTFDPQYQLGLLIFKMQKLKTWKTAICDSAKEFECAMKDLQW